MQEASGALRNLLNNDSLAFKDIVHECYAPHELSAYSLIEVRFRQNMTEEKWERFKANFYIEKLSLEFE